MSSFLSHLFTASLLCCTTIGFTQDSIPSYSSKFWSGDKEHYRMGLRHIEAGGIGYNNGYTTVDGFIAPTPNPLTLMPFLDIRGSVFNNGTVATNLGVGFRKIAGCRIYGVNAYYDYRNNEHEDYNQMGFGVETLGKRWDFRINAYLPIERNITPVGQAAFTEFAGHHMILAQNYQFAMKGANANFGFHFGKNWLCDFYACAGPYFYAGKIGPHIWGGKASFMIRFNKYVTIELSNSYDEMFLNRFQAQVGFTIPFGTVSDEPQVDSYNSCDISDLLLSRMTQSVQRQEIIVIGQSTKNTAAINPATSQPYRFVFVDNTSNSFGTYESPYHSLRQAQDNSRPGDVIYVFPGDGTTRGMDQGIILQQNQNFWGSGISHALQASQGNFTIPAQSTTAPTMTNMDIDSLGDGITLSSVNQVSGFNIVDVLNNGILGSNVENLLVDRCTFQGAGVYCINSASEGQATVSVTNNTMTNNTNGSFFDFSGSSNLLISGNTITGTTSISSVPIEVAAGINPLSARITNNNISNNETGAFRLALSDTSLATLTINDNTVTNNNSGSQASLGSALVILPNSSGEPGNCYLGLANNSFSSNHGNALYCHTSGGFNDFYVTATNNSLIENGGGLVFANTATTFTLHATDNTILNGQDNGIAVIGTTIPTANVTISNNEISGARNASNAIALTHTGTDLNLTVNNNNLNDNEGTGILMYSSSGIENATINIENNIINNNLNLSSNASGGVDLEQYTNLFATITNNTLSDNASSGLYVGSTLSTPFVDLTLSGNDSTNDYMLANPVDGTFNLAPCNVETVNEGTISKNGTITMVQYCPGGAACSP